MLPLGVVFAPSSHHHTIPRCTKITRKPSPTKLNLVAAALLFPPFHSRFHLLCTPLHLAILFLESAHRQHQLSSSSVFRLSPSSSSIAVFSVPRKVAKLIEENVGAAMQFLQSKALCIMPISRQIHSLLLACFYCCCPCLEFTTVAYFGGIEAVEVAENAVVDAGYGAVAAGFLISQFLQFMTT
ncbi:hypothetical protein PIB30_063209 [Stylosanthes scabra]|uniref:Uncharacterized protein n=1 Tax=Stylosanthes scabra TaxID=79078 RepID=A0ABU6YKR2_9FABA|nr:hypothetical protein [Stylosanthes scabra]